MIGKPGEKTPYDKCDNCGKSAPTANLWTTKDGCNICLDCYSARGKHGEGEARAKRGRSEEREGGPP